MYLECAMSIPRYVFEEAGRKFARAIVRSGGDKNYLEHIIRKPKYLITCIYAAGFVVLGSTAGNAIVFAQHMLILGDCDPEIFRLQTGYAWTVKGIAVGMITFVCVFHSVWRAGGIYLNNFLAITKLSGLIFVICSGLWWHSKNASNPERPNNFAFDQAFKRTPYAKGRSSMQAAGDFVYSLIFAFCSSAGFEATNNVRRSLRLLLL